MCKTAQICVLVVLPNTLAIEKEHEMMNTYRFNGCNEVIPALWVLGFAANCLAHFVATYLATAKIARVLAFPVSVYINSPVVRA
jgi:hypothetical protein